MAITIEPLMWNNLPKMNDDLELDDTDEKCFEEIKVSSGKIRSNFKICNSLVTQAF